MARALTVAGLELTRNVTGTGWRYRQFEFLPMTITVGRMKRHVRVWVIIGRDMKHYPTLTDAVNSIKPELARQLAIAKREIDAHSVALSADRVLTRYGSGKRAIRATNRTGVTR